MHELEMPEQFLDLISLHSMMLLLFSRISNSSDLKNSDFAEILPHLKEINLSFNTIYKENNIRKRLLYFKTPLIKWLWKLVFINKKPEIFIMHLRRVRSYPCEGEERFRTLILDMRYCEKKCDIVLIPDQARQIKNVTLFTRSEAEEDLKINGKYNKKS